LWLAAHGEYEPAPSLTGELDIDLAVIGGGLTGWRRERVATPREPDSLVVAAPLGPGDHPSLGGPFSITADLTLALCHIGDERDAVCALGCMGTASR
jgi:hypothetical protein